MTRHRLISCATVLLASLVAASAVGQPRAIKKKGEDEYIKVEVKGKLEVGVVAIGGETTGITINARGIILELEFGKQKTLQQLAHKLHGKSALVAGTLERRPGVEVPDRWIVHVHALRPVGAR